MAGTWKDLTDSVNANGRKPDESGSQHRGRNPRPWRAATSSRKITVDVKGEMLELKNTVNTRW